MENYLKASRKQISCHSERILITVTLRANFYLNIFN